MEDEGQNNVEAADGPDIARTASGPDLAAGTADGSNNAGPTGRRRNLIRHDAADVEKARQIVERSRVLADRIIKEGWQQYTRTITEARAKVARHVAKAREKDILGIEACRARRIRIINKSARDAANIVSRARKQAAVNIARSQQVAGQIIGRARVQNAHRAAVRARRGRAGARGHLAERPVGDDEEL